MRRISRVFVIVVEVVFEVKEGGDGSELNVSQLTLATGQKKILYTSSHSSLSLSCPRFLPVVLYPISCSLRHHPCLCFNIRSIVMAGLKPEAVT